MREKNIQNILTSTKGFSLIETIVIVALFTIIMLAISDSIASFYRMNAYTIAQAYQIDNARQGIDIMVRDLREMTFADNGTFPLVRMSTTSIGFYSDTDRDDSVEYIEYVLTGTTLYKKLFNATGTPLTYNTAQPDSTFTLSEYVQNNIQNIPIFVYFDDTGNVATNGTPVTDIRYIQTSVIINIDPIRDPGQYMLRSSTALRNLKSN